MRELISIPRSVSEAVVTTGTCELVGVVSSLLHALASPVGGLHGTAHVGNAEDDCDIVSLTVTGVQRHVERDFCSLTGTTPKVPKLYILTIIMMIVFVIIMVTW